VRENVRRLRPELWRQKLAAASRQRTVSHFLFHQEIFDQKNNMTVVSHPSYYSVSPIEDKYEKPPF
jgi:hypothetical protein